MKTKLRESTQARKGRALLITEGVGSSGKYSAEVLQRDGATALPAGTQIFLNHIGESEYWERSGSRDVKDIIGRTTEAAVWDESLLGLAADIEIFPHAKELVESVWEHVALSIEASGVVTDDGVVESLVYSPLNAVALVPVGGRGGKVAALYEGYVESRGTLNPDESASREEDGMTPEDITKVAEALAEALKPSLTAIHEALTPEVEPADKTEAPEVSEVAEALVASGLAEKSRARVYEAVKAGTAVADAITAEKNLVAEILAESATNTDEVNPGRIYESAAGTERPAFKAWG